MPGEADSKYALWKAALKEEFARLADGAILLGHSIGATILINVLAEEPFETTLSGIYLISVLFVGQGGWSSDDIEPMSDLGETLEKQWRIYIYHGSEDDTVQSGHVDLYEKAIPQALFRRLAGRDHQLNEDLSQVAADIRQL
jgi:predicted alpha/beta hydrolase family esterase